MEVQETKKEFLTAPLSELKFFPDTIDSYASLHKFSVENRELFWSYLAKSRLEWFEEFTQITEGKFTDADFRLKWFIGGKLNVSGRRKKQNIVLLIEDHDILTKKRF